MALINKLSAIGEAIREKTGGTEQLTLDAMPDEIRGITAGDGGGSGSLPAGVYFQPLDMRAPNKYSQAWVMFNGTRYVFSNSASGNGSLANVYKMDDTANTHTQIVSNTASALGMGNAGGLCYVEFNGKVYISDVESKSYTVFDGTTLTKVSDALPNSVDRCLFIHNNKLKAYSYYDGTVYVFDETSNTWSAEATVLAKYYYCKVYVVNGVPYFVWNTTVYTYDGSAVTQVGTCKSHDILGCVIGDCIYYGTSQTNKPYALYKYDTTNNQETMLGVVAPGDNYHSRFWEYNDKLAFLSSSANAGYSVTNMLVHIIEATE